ncbi:MAG: hypothetical protein KDC53_08875 [Saprospiraceae bacterium]|nr:hypothetical protein [Saprospiraceae bacterium]
MRAQDLQGSKQRFVLHSNALEGNLIGDSPDREVSVYLPPSYTKDTTKSYPVLYLLHGYTDSDSKWFGFENHWINFPRLIDSVITAGSCQEMIVVMPNAYNTFKGSFYSSSLTIGDWETFVTEELVTYIDDHYRTLASRDSRGLAGHSMGGYGTIRLGMKFPDIYSSIYLLSPCCMSTNSFDNDGLRKNTQAVTQKEQIADQPFFVSAALALAAAWAPDPDKSPLFLDLPFDDGGSIDDIQNKFAANAILNMVDQYIYNLTRLENIGMDAGMQDYGIHDDTRHLHEILDESGVNHLYESYEGNHVNKIAERITRKMLPFFSENLKFN